MDFGGSLKAGAGEGCLKVIGKGNMVEEDGNTTSTRKIKRA